MLVLTRVRTTESFTLRLFGSAVIPAHLVKLTILCYFILNYG